EWAILIHKKLPFIFKEQITDCEGRYVLVRGLLYGQEFSLLNIYVPNEDCPKFMTDKITLFSQYTSDFGIIPGDFNCCMDSNLDKSSMLTPNIDRTLSVATREAGLVDVWKEFNPTSKDYTFYSARHKTYSRLDFFLLP
uniref:Endonuclease/exonuclease/phosphatase domain-containing protein n=1 Tax=Pygocentrus nattereri TaxID=42514 RepID=A0AAR2LN82_PYGNA